MPQAVYSLHPWHGELDRVQYWESCRPILLCITMTEGAVQIDCLFVTDMIEENGLVHRHPAKNRKEEIKNGFGLIPITMVGNDEEEDDNDNKNKKGKSFFHIHYLYWIDLKSVKKKPAERPSTHETVYPE